MDTSTRTLSRFLQGRNAEGATLVDRLKIGYRPYICPFDDLLGLVPEGAAVFDIGCGNGMFLCLVREFCNPRALGGVEISPDLVDNAAAILGDLDAQPPVWLQVFDGSELPVEIRDFSHVFLIDVLHHVARQRQTDFLRAIYARMATGARFVLKDIDAGSVVLSKFNKLHDLVLAGEIGHELEASMVRRELEAIGFRTFPIAKRRMLVYPHYTIVCDR